MNRFLTRRKGQDDDGGKKKKGKKGQVEPKPEFNIQTALPKAEDFRTSLIMPGLSTRFSMLREQDDPHSKLGKASDDSVLQPKRQSRLHEFGFVPGGLSDIAEVSSLNGSIRPPFANERHGSFDSTRDDDAAGGMMSRARPGEGNVLFGGRQKIYKIPNAATSKGGLGRVLYEDDVNLSTFQKLRQEEKEQRRREMEAAAEQQDGQQSEPSSPTTISQRRETSSSTNSGTLNTRSSTAATSIASQGANSIPVSSPAFPNMAAPTSPTELTRSTTKGRRLYDQGLDQHIHEQQSSAMNRLNSLQRSRAPTGRSTPPLLYSQTKSATNLNDRFTRGIALRTESPTLQGYPSSANGREPQSAGSSPVIPYPHSPPPLSPLASDSEEAQTLHAAIKPHDRGKATAMGAFNKPKQAFNEQQYAERLKRMQQERDAPSPKPESPRKLTMESHQQPSLENEAPRKPSLEREGSRNPSLENPRKPSQENPRKMTLRERAELEKRKRAEAAEAGRQRSESSAADQREIPSAFSVFQAAANRMKDHGPPSPAPMSKLPSPPVQRVQSPDQLGTTFFASPGSSDDEDETAPKNSFQKATDMRSRIENIPVATGPAPPIFEHPALRSQNSSAEELEQQHPALRPQVNEPTPRPDSETNVPDADVDSPTLGPNNGGLSGLIRQHLRTISNVSSNYGDSDQPITSPPAVTPVGLGLQTQNLGLQRRQPTSEADTPAPSSYSHSNPWDLDDIDNPYRDERDSVSSVSPVENHRINPHNLNGAIKEAAEWEPEVKKAHSRELSAESNDEHEAFQRDLAQRQRIIQESLRAKAEGRSVSPAPGGLKTALSMLRAKSSRESFATVDRQHERQHDHSIKAMKMLGISAGNSTNASTASLANPGSDHAPPLRQKPSRVLQQSEQDAHREAVNRQRSATNDSNNRDARTKGRSPPASTRSSTRDRSSSEASSGGRSRSRHRAYRDDLEQAMAEGTSRGTVYPANIPSPSIPGYVANPTQPLPAERPSLDSQNQSSGRMRSRSNSRTTAANYFESKHLQPLHTGNAFAPGHSPRLSPGPNVPTPQFSPGLPASPRPSPGGPSPSMNAFRPQGSPVPPFSANHTPPVSNPATPVAPGFTSPRPEFQPLNKTGTLRKKSIAKSDISEPVFLSTTSVIDTVSLPPGASLKNGIDSAAPPVPPINPMRRRFGFGRSEPTQDAGGLEGPRAPHADPPRTNSSDALASQASAPRQRLRKTSSEGKSLHGRAQAQTGANPPMPPATATLGRNNSPPRPINQQHYAQQPMNGAMF